MIHFCSKSIVVVFIFCISTLAIANFETDACSGVDKNTIDQKVQILKKNGYSESVAMRITCLRPDIAYLIEHPEVKVSYDVPIHDKAMAVTSTISQNRRAIKVYRGFSLAAEKYNPRFVQFWAASIPGVMFVAKNAGWAFAFANHIGDGRPGQRAGDPALLLEYEIPKFFLRTEYTPGQPITESNDVIIYREVMPDDSPFISKVLIMKKSKKYEISSPANLIERFKPFNDVLPQLPLVKPRLDIRFDEKGNTSTDTFSSE